jgi:hypothetical protein
MNSPLDFSANRRLGPRRVVDVEVFVTSEGSEIKRCRLRDISIDGAFIETTSFTLTEGTKLDLVLRILRKEKTEACPVPAEVIRVTEDGAALIFGRVDQRLYNTLADIVGGADRISTGNETAFVARMRQSVGTNAPPDWHHSWWRRCADGAKDLLAGKKILP